MTTRLANALQRHRHLKGARVLCQKNGQPLRANMLAYLLERATRKAGLATGRKPRHAGPHVLRHTFCSHLSMRGAPARAVRSAFAKATADSLRLWMIRSVSWQARSGLPAVARSQFRRAEAGEPGRNRPLNPQIKRRYATIKNTNGLSDRARPQLQPMPFRGKSKQPRRNHDRDRGRSTDHTPV
jgi:Phage integrase family